MKWILCAAIFLSAIIGVVRIYNRVYQKAEREGYERGAYQGAVFARCEGNLPTPQFKSEMWNLVNMPDDCGFVAAVIRK